MASKIRLGILGGGIGSFIGSIHTRAALLDGEFELVCGAFSSSPEISKQSGKLYHLPPSRVYGSWQELVQAEKELHQSIRMEVLAITTPNHLHFPQAMSALSSGFHVVCDKPVAISLAEAMAIEAKVAQTGLGFALTHNYTGYPMVMEAKNLVMSGRIGNVRKVVVEYPQGWLATPVEQGDSKQARWRTNPSLSGPGGCLGDIGTHAENLAEYITGLTIDEICADTSTLVANRLLDDDVTVLIRYKGGARGILLASQVSAGEENNLRIRVYGDKGGIEWQHCDPNSLTVRIINQPICVLRAGSNYSYLSNQTRWNLRIPGGHPEGFIESFANIYRNFAHYLNINHRGGKHIEGGFAEFPTIADGVRGMRFVERVVEAAARSEKWIVF